MWYKDSYRRHLCDMHIEDWDDRFLSEFSPEEYYQNLKLAKIQSAMIYFQSHVGYCYYPTKVGHMHKGFVGKEDMMKTLVDKCRQGGITVTGYYSLIYNNWAHDQHPDWRMVTPNGKSNRGNTAESVELCDIHRDRYGLCCPNNLEYRDFIFTQMREMNEYFEVDGMFFDMLFWQHMCYCESCKKRWKDEVGGEIPIAEDWNDEKWRLHVRKRREWLGEFANAVTDETRRLSPNISVEHNYSTAVKNSWRPCCGEEVNEACDYAGGDLYGDILNHSFTCKFYKNITKNQPFEYMFSRCHPHLSKHTTIKSKNIMKTSTFLTAAHHGATLVIDAIDPVGTLDRRVYEQLGKVFSESAEYEPFFKGEMIEDIGVYYSLVSKFNTLGESYTNHSGSVNTVRTLIEKNISVGVTGGYADIFKHKVVVAPCLTTEDDNDVPRIIEYVKNGGTLYFSGAENPKLLLELMGGVKTATTEETAVYISPKEDKSNLFEYFNKTHPLPYDGKAPIVENIEEENVYATLTLPYTKQAVNKFASIHSNPPGIYTNIPVIAVRKYGSGTVIWSALPLEDMDMEESKLILLNLIFSVFDESKLSLQSDAPKSIELVSFKTEDSILLSAVHLNEEYKAFTVNDFTVKIKMAQKPKYVVKLPNKEEISFNYNNGYAEFCVKDLSVMNMYKISI